MPQTVIATVGTSLLTNRDGRPWAGKPAIGDVMSAVEWLEGADLDLASAETNTLWRLDLQADDQVHLLHSDTPEGLECAEVLRAFLRDGLGQLHVAVHRLPGLHYDLDGAGSALERLADLLRTLIEASKHVSVTLAATGGFKAEVMMMALVGQATGVPVCYVHERYKALIYLPWLDLPAPPRAARKIIDIPSSGTPRERVVKLSELPHHRPKALAKIEHMLRELPWVDRVRFDELAFGAPKNGVKAAPRGTDDGRHVLWLHWEDAGGHIALAIETTGHTPEHKIQCSTELRERVGRLL